MFPRLLAGIGSRQPVERQGFDPADQMERSLHRWHEGYLSNIGRCFDIGSVVRSVLARFEQTGEPYSGSTDPYSAGNDSLMRLAPVPVFYASRPIEAIEQCAVHQCKYS